MWLSSLKRAAGVAGAVGLACSFSGIASAAQTYVQPEVKLTVETNSNRDLDATPGADTPQTQGYFADLAATFGIVTPRSDTTIRPRLRYQSYPDRDSVEELETFLDFYTSFRTQRSQFSTYGQFERRDTYNADLSDPLFNDLNPDGSTSADAAGVSSAGETRDLIFLQPKYRYTVNQRLSVGVDAMYEMVDYSSDARTGRTSYDFVKGGGSIGWTATERLSYGAGVYVSRYEGRDEDLHSDGVGLTLDVNYKIREGLDASLQLIADRNEIEGVRAVAFRDDTSGVGAAVTVVSTGPVSNLRLSAGRTFSPSGNGGVFAVNQFQIQYDRRFSQRLTWRNGVLFYQDRSIADALEAGDRDYLSAGTWLRWSMTRTWFIEGGLRHVREEDVASKRSASNTSVALSAGYLGLGRRP